METFQLCGAGESWETGSAKIQRMKWGLESYFEIPDHGYLEVEQVGFLRYTARLAGLVSSVIRAADRSNFKAQP